MFPISIALFRLQAIPAVQSGVWWFAGTVYGIMSGRSLGLLRKFIEGDSKAGPHYWSNFLYSRSATLATPVSDCSGRFFAEVTRYRIAPALCKTFGYFLAFCVVRLVIRF